MPRFRHILFPVDFSERSKTVRPYVKLFARQFNAKLTLMNVVQYPPGVYAGLDASFPVMFDFPSLEPQIRTLLDEYLAPNPTEFGEVQKVVEYGDPASIITDYARQHAVDLIMLPTHGYGRFRSFLLGSVAAKVLHDADCSVWTAAHTEDPAMMEHVQIRSILAAIEPVEDQGRVICGAAELGREFGATVRLVHAIPAAERHPADTSGEEFSLYLLRAAREQIESLQRQARTNFEIIVEAGSVAETVRRVALEHHADLVVTGRGVLHDTLGRLRTKSYDIIRQSPCPVLSV